MLVEHAQTLPARRQISFGARLTSRLRPGSLIHIRLLSSSVAFNWVQSDLATYITPHTQCSMTVCAQIILFGGILIFILDVEHSSAPGPGNVHGSLPPLQYEGFEPSPYDRDDARADMFQVSTLPSHPAHRTRRPCRIQWIYPLLLLPYSSSEKFNVPFLLLSFRWSSPPTHSTWDLPTISLSKSNSLVRSSSFGFKYPGSPPNSPYTSSFLTRLAGTSLSRPSRERTGTSTADGRSRDNSRASR